VRRLVAFCRGGNVIDVRRTRNNMMGPYSRKRPEEAAGDVTQWGDVKKGVVSRDIRQGASEKVFEYG
jgi:hypothetical protein